MPSRVVLAPILPPQTAVFRRLEKSNVELDRFDWTLRCAADRMLPAVASVGRGVI